MRNRNSASSSPIRENSYSNPKNSDRCRRWARAPCSISIINDLMKRVTQDTLPMISFPSSSDSTFR